MKASIGKSSWLALFVSVNVVSGAAAEPIGFSLVDEEPLKSLSRNVFTAAWGDYDGDGRPDIFLAAEDSGTGELYHNTSTGFEKVTTSPVVTDSARRASAAWGDWDNDGDLDLFVAGLGGVDFYYRNLGAGAFEALTPVPNPSGPSIAGVFSDFNRDGWLDIAIASGSGIVSIPNVLRVALLQDAGSAGPIVPITTGEAVQEFGHWHSATLSDYDSDGDADLLFVDLTGPTSLFRNAEGSFVRTQSGGIGSDVPAQGGTIGAWADSDNDGDLDLIIAGTGFAFTLFYTNDGVGGLGRVLDGPIPNAGGDSAGAVWADFDNDGWQDLLLPKRSGRHLLFRGTGGGGFTQVTTGLIPEEVLGANGVAVADYDLDGDLDVLLCPWGYAAPRLFRNDTSGNNWLRVRLDGDQSNGSGIGAKVRVRATIRGETLWQLREIGGFDPGGSQELVAHFGLGDAASAEVVRIEWPSGEIQEFEGISPGQIFVVTEPASPRLFTRAASAALDAISPGALGAAWGDYDGDDRPDLAFAMQDSSGGVLIRNAASGFERAASVPIDTDPFMGIGVSWADFDSDGDLDLLHANSGDSQSETLYRNDEGSFVAVTGDPLVSSGGASQSAIWMDYNADGNLDVLVVNGGGLFAQPNFLFRGVGNGAFERVNNGALVTDIARWQGGSWGDFDGDGAQDAFVAHGDAKNALYRNRRDGTFERVQSSVFDVSGPIIGSGTGAWGDFDNDGDLDLAVPGNGTPICPLFRNDNGTFQRVNVPALDAASGASFTAGWADLDNDGWLDLIVANRTGRTFLFRGLGQGQFEPFPAGQVGDVNANANAIAIADYDGDGDLDLLLINWLTGPPALYQNESTGNNWLRVQLAGQGLNLRALGAKVRVQSVIGGEVIRQLRQIGGEDNSASQEPIAHFGLGDASKVDLLLIEWPSGQVQELIDVTPNQVLTVTEPEAHLQITPNGGRFDGGVEVTLSTDIAGAEIRYTLDGSNPALSSTLYVGPIGLTQSAEVRARVFQEGAANGPIRRAVFTVEPVPALRFSDVDDAPLTTTSLSTYSAAWGDYDGDGFPDPYLASLFNAPAALFRNTGTNFEQIAAAPVGDGIASRAGALWVDTDNDGDLDLFVATTANENDLRYINSGDGTFTQVSDDPTVVSGGYGQSATAADFDQDGSVDLFVSNGGGFLAEQNFLFLNTGSGAFTRVTQGDIATEVHPSAGAASADYDGDGRMDLFVANIYIGNSLFRNIGQGAFERVVEGPIVTETETVGATSAAWGDYDNDGDLDLFVSTGSTMNHLYRNEGQGQFVKVASPPVTTDGGFSAGAVFVDFDNDGWLDLLVARREGSSLLYRGTKTGFEAVTTGPIADRLSGVNGVAAADYDKDGDVDVLMSNWLGLGTHALFRNETTGNSWLRVRLIGRMSNRSGIGARVSVRATIAGETFWQLRQIGGEDAQGSQELIAHFGLGDASQAEVVRIQWPSGQVQELSDVSGGQLLVVEEPAQPPIIDIQPEGQTVVVGESVELGVLASGPRLTFQWFFEDEVLSGETNATLSIEIVEASDAGTYRVKVSNRGGEVLSDPVELVVLVDRTLALGTISSVREGTRVKLPLLLQSDGTVGGGTLVVRYDPEVLTPLSVDWIGRLTNAFKEVNLSVPGKVRLVFALSLLPAVPTGDQTLAELVFRTRSVGSNLVTRLDLEVIDLSNASGQPLRSGTDVKGTEVEVLHRQIVGDNNGNGRLDIGDASVILQFLSQLEPRRSWDIPNNDVNLSDTLDSGDAVSVLRSVVALPGSDPRRTDLSTTSRRLILQGPAANAAPGEAPVTVAGLGAIRIEPSTAQPGESVTVRVNLEKDGATAGASFALRYPSQALRLRNADSLRVGGLVPSTALSLWNVAPSNSFSLQNGLAYFAASSAGSWTTGRGVLAELSFEVLAGALDQPAWDLVLEEVESTDDGYQLLTGPTVTATFISRPAVRATIHGLTRNTDGSWSLRMTGEPNARYRIEVSADLEVWSPVVTATAGADGSLEFAEESPASSPAYRFYRVVQED